MTKHVSLQCHVVISTLNHFLMRGNQCQSDVPVQIVNMFFYIEDNPLFNSLIIIVINPKGVLLFSIEYYSFGKNRTWISWLQIQCETLKQYNMAVKKNNCSFSSLLMHLYGMSRSLASVQVDIWTWKYWKGQTANTLFKNFTLSWVFTKNIVD